jgi:RNA polymerase sigma-70 factor (ECF subfamily)
MGAPIPIARKEPMGDASDRDGREAGRPHDADTTLWLLERARNGDSRALGRLCERVLPAVRQWARGQVPREARGMLDTDDLVQDTLLRTMDHVSRLETERQRGLYMYLRQALRNRIRDELRKVQRRPGPALPVPSAVPEPAPGPLERLIGRQKLERYEAALGRLDPDEQAMVVARIEFGLGWREIADVSGKSSEDAARMAVGRALARIASELGDD